MNPEKPRPAEASDPQDRSRAALFGAIEAGGSKVVCAVGTDPSHLVASTVIATTSARETLEKVVAFFAGQQRLGHHLEAIGVASFGPLDLDPASPTYGYITTTTKPGWAGTDLLGPLTRAFEVPIALDTDVNGAAYGEYRWGASAGLTSSVYLTVGTGIGGGRVLPGRTPHGAWHPEMGHLQVRRHPADTFAGVCPFHHDCLEGLASGPAISARSGRPAQHLDGDRGAAVEMEAWYLAQLVSAVIYLLCPQRIVLGGGVLGLPGLLEAVRLETTRRLAGALHQLVESAPMRDYLVAPGLGPLSGVLGAIAMAEQVAHTQPHPRPTQSALPGPPPAAARHVSLNAVLDRPRQHTQGERY